jgi:flagellar motor protein MotB
VRQPEKKLPRVERDEVSHVSEDENQHLWAVSYSDFLMVLLSFFVLFFDAEPPQKQKLILELANHFTSPASGKSSGTGEGSGTGPGSGNHRMPASILESLKNLNVTVDKEKESLIINFPNDLYGPGQHKMDKNKIALIQDFLNIIKPYQANVLLYFEGHADGTPLLRHKNSIVVDNFVLSSLRASSALGYARDMGFSEKTMFIQAASSNLRNSRSLSIRIEARGEIL